MKVKQTLAAAGLLLLTLLQTTAAAEDETIVNGRTAVKCYPFEAAAGDKLHYDAPERLTIDGKTYVLDKVQYEVTAQHEPIRITKTVICGEAPQEITETVDGQSRTLKADTLPAAPKIETREYTAQADIAQSLTVAGEQYTLQAVTDEVRTESWESEAVFTTPNPASRFYQFNGQTVELDDAPVWMGYEQAVADYLGKNTGSVYQVQSGVWRGDFQAVDGGYTRMAVYSGTRSYRVWTGRYSTPESAEVIYSDPVYPNGWVEAEAVAAYTREGGSVLETVLKIGGGAAVLALAVSGIIFLLKRKKKETTDEESEV